MKRILGIVLSCILGWILLTFLVAIVFQSQDYYGQNPVLRKRLEVLEPFASGSASEAKADPVPDLVHLPNAAPGDPELNKPREPYSLLAGWLPGVTCDQYPTAERCRAVDFQTRLERTGNCRQLTNNYKRGDPNSCSAPIQDLVMNFYKTDPLP